MVAERETSSVLSRHFFCVLNFPDRMPKRSTGVIRTNHPGIQ